MARLIGRRVSDRDLIRVLRTCPRSTTAAVADALREDLRVIVDESTLRTQLTRLHEAGVVGRADHQNYTPRYFTWWVI